ncbi:MAG: arsenic resistance N-acetyltransferase ArsN2 [Ginsengibacter sp.]
MKIITKAIIRSAANEDRQSIITLLKEEKLPVEDLPASLANFLVASENDKIIGVIGLEKYRSLALLRSMAVSMDYRNNNVASQLVEQLETFAKSSGIKWMYLLTETAEQYFERQAYQKVSRESAPKEIQASSEFSNVCPESAIFMRKGL